MLLGSSVMSAAQQYRIDYIQGSLPWLSTDNPAALTTLNIPHVSEGRVGLTSENGGFHDFRQPQSALTLAADVESYYRIMPRMVGYGRMAYQNSSLHHVAGSAFMDSQHMPFDIVEDSLTNEGNAHRDVYNIIGGLSYSLHPHLAIGAQLDFKAANYAKYKDLRHKNTLTDINVKAGLFIPTTFISIGANAYYRRTIEGVTFSIYGSEDKIYRSLIDYGILTGEIETFGEQGYTEKGEEHPLVSEQKGFSVQMGMATADSCLTWTNEFAYRSREGYYGRDSEYDIVYSRHDGNIYKASSILALHEHANIHQLRFSLGIENLRNLASTYRTIQDTQTTAHYYEYYTPVKTANKVWADYTIGYNGYLSVNGNVPRWQLSAAYGHSQREQTIYYYPYSRHQLLSANTLSATVLRNISIHEGTLGIKGSLAYRWGNGDIYDDLTLATPSDKQREPDTMTEYQLRDYHSFTAPQYTAGIALRYSHPFSPQPSACLEAYIEVSAAVSHVNGSAADSFTGNERRCFSITLGSHF